MPSNERTYTSYSLDWIGIKDPWTVEPDLNALHQIVCNIFRLGKADCGEPFRIGLHQHPSYARIYSLSLPGRQIIARLVAPVQPLFKTEAEVAAMDFIRGG